MGLVSVGNDAENFVSHYARELDIQRTVIECGLNIFAVTEMAIVLSRVRWGQPWRGAGALVSRNVHRVNHS